MRILVALLLLTGCASHEVYWHTDMPGYVPAVVSIRLTDDVDGDCGLPKGSGVMGCAVRMRNEGGAPYALLYIQRSMPRQRFICVAQHEFRHALGDNHDKKETKLDCGAANG